MAKQSEREYQRADPAARRRALQKMLPLFLVGLLTAVALTTLANRADAGQSVQMLFVMLALLVVICLVMLWPIRRLWLIGRDAGKTQRFPPPGLTVLRDTPVFHGEEARRRGRVMQVFATTLGVFVILTPLALIWLVSALVHPLSGY